jgi:hypothetical protein
MAMFSNLSALELFIQERAVYVHEKANGMYRYVSTCLRVCVHACIRVVLFLSWLVKGMDCIRVVLCLLCFGTLCALFWLVLCVCVFLRCALVCGAG